MAAPQREVGNSGMSGKGGWNELVQKVGTNVLAGQRTLPITGDLAGFFPGGIKRGTTVSITGSTSTVLQAIAAATIAGSWCAAVGQRRLNCVAAVEAGVSLERFVMISEPGVKWLTVVGALLDGFDIVLVGSGAGLRDSDVRKLSSRARQRESVLMVAGSWPRADIRLTVHAVQWSGLGRGHGHFGTCDREVTAYKHGMTFTMAPVRASIDSKARAS